MEIKLNDSSETNGSTIFILTVLKLQEIAADVCCLYNL